MKTKGKISDRPPRYASVLIIKDMKEKRSETLCAPTVLGEEHKPPMGRLHDGTKSDFTDKGLKELGHLPNCVLVKG